MSDRPVHAREWSEGERVPTASSSEIRRLLNHAWHATGPERRLANAQLALAEMQLWKMAPPGFDIEYLARVERDAYDRGYANARSKYRNDDSDSDPEGLELSDRAPFGVVHEWESDFSGSGQCAAMVERDGGGDQCGLYQENAIHYQKGEGGS